MVNSMLCSSLTKPPMWENNPVVNDSARQHPVEVIAPPLGRRKCLVFPFMRCCGLIRATSLQTSMKLFVNILP